MTKAILVMVALLVGLSGCASHRPSAYSVNGQETLIGWTNQDKLPSNAYYVLLEGSPDESSWTVKEIYNHPIAGRSNVNQEVLFVDKEFLFVQPYFEVNESTVVNVGESTTMNLVGRANSNGQPVVTGADFYTSTKYLDRGSWECGYFFQSDTDKYTPCTTRLTRASIAKSIGKNIMAIAVTLGTMSGTHQVVDKDKVAEVLEKAHVFEEIKKSKYYSKAEVQ